MKRNPWFKFEADAWLNDVHLRSCSSAARGTLIDLMCLAHRNSDYGVCMANEDLSTRKMTAKCLSLTLRTFDNHLTSLLQMQRICRASDGRLFIKRMVADFANSEKHSANGAKGGNPSLLGVNPPLKAEESKKRREEKRGEEIPLKSPQGTGRKPKELTAAEKKRARVQANTPDMVRLGSLFRRRPDSLWNLYEAGALEQILPINESDMAAMQAYYSANIPESTDFRRRNLEQVLNNWLGEVDRANTWKRASVRPNPKRSCI